MKNDVEMNEIKVALIDSHETTKDEKVPDVEVKTSKVNEEFAGLTKEELEKYAKDPFWRKLRLILFIGFWFIWIAMLVIAILIVAFSPKCPKTKKLEFWEKETGYWVDTLGYVDSNGDGIGDFDGLITRLNYIQNQLGAGYLILDPIFSGQYSAETKMLGSVDSFRNIDSFVGNQESFKKLIKESRKRGLEVVLSVDFNALSQTSNFIKSNPSVVTNWNSQMTNWVARDGKSSKKNFDNKDIYSYAGDKSNMIDLDLRNEIVLKEIEDSVKMWLDLEVRGFLLTNVAVYIENTTFPATPTNYNENENKWYKFNSMKGQIFSTETSIFVKRIRDIMNKVAKKTDKSRLLILDAGNIGFGLDSTNVDPMIQYLDDPANIADMVISREFLKYRGWNIKDVKRSNSSVKNYLNMTDKNKFSKIALTSATSTSHRITELQKLAAPFLLPGNPILYFGSEIGVQCDVDKINAINVPFYPKDRQFPLESVVGELPMKCNHMIMQWDNNGKGFNNDNKTTADPYIVEAQDTVQALTAVGREETIFQLYQKLIKVRNEPSLQWGMTEMFIDEKTPNGRYEIFIREASGFPKIIVALLQDDIDGKVFSLSSICAKIKPLIVYPSNIKLPENKEVNADNIYMKIYRKESIHVFKCIT